MRIYGLDFTSNPSKAQSKSSRAKRLILAICLLEGFNARCREARRIEYGHGRRLLTFRGLAQLKGAMGKGNDLGRRHRFPVWNAGGGN